MAYRHVYVDPDATDTPEDGTTWGKAYASLNAAEQAEDNTGDIATSNEIVVFHCRASSGTEDTAAVTVSGWTTSADDFIVIVAEAIDTSYGSGSAETTGTGRHHGIWSTSHYRLNVANSNVLLIQEDFVRLEGLQLAKSSSSANGQACVNINTVTAGATYYISTCLTKQCDTGPNTYSEPGLSISDTDITVYVWNCICYGAGALNNSSNATVYLNVSAASVFGCTLVGGYYGIRRVAGTVAAKNCYASAAGNDYEGTITQTTCASSDTTADGTALDSIAYDTTEGAGHAGFTNVTVGSENFTLKSGSALVGAGTTLTDDPPGSTALGVDIIGTTRSVTWDIGAFEYVSAAARAGLIMAGRTLAGLIRGGLIH